MMKVAFYKGKKRFFNKFVSWWTNGPYSHVEIVLSNGYSYSSSYADCGVRKKKIAFKSKEWDFIYINTENEFIVKERINKMLYNGFDTLGLLSFVFRRGKYVKNKVFCSEFVMSVLGYRDSFRFDPNTCYVTLEKTEKINDCKSRQRQY
jgi:hypothetical protein